VDDAGADLSGDARDEADRDRQRVDFLLQLTPLDTLSITPSASWRHDDFPNSPFGVELETSWSAGVEGGWNPIDRLSFTASYVHEALTSLNTDAISNMADTVDTFHVSGKMGLIQKVLDRYTRRDPGVAPLGYADCGRRASAGEPASLLQHHHPPTGMVAMAAMRGRVHCSLGQVPDVGDHIADLSVLEL
jgi:hypothetical protein